MQTIHPRLTSTTMTSPFRKITQICNSTDDRVGFQIPNCIVRHSIRDLPPRTNDFVKLNNIIRCNWDFNGHWDIGVLINGHHSGIDMNSWILLKNVRIVFRYEEGVFCMILTPERWIDNVLRLRCFGSKKRDTVWSNRLTVEPIRADSEKALNRKNEWLKKNQQSMKLKQKKKDDHPKYIVTIEDTNSLNPPTAAIPRITVTSTQQKLEEVPNLNTIKLAKGELDVIIVFKPQEVCRSDSDNPFESNASCPDRGLNCESVHSVIPNKVPEEFSLRGSVSPRLPTISEVQSDLDTDRRLPPSLRNTEWLKKYQQVMKHVEKASYEEGKKDDHSPYTSTVIEKGPTPRMTAVPSIIDSTSQRKLEKVPKSNTVKLTKGELGVIFACSPLDFENPCGSIASSPDYAFKSGSAHSFIPSKVTEELSLGGSVSPQLLTIRELKSGWDTDRRLPPSLRKTKWLKMDRQGMKHVEKASYEEGKKDDHPAGISTANEKGSTPRTSAISGISVISVNQQKLEKGPTSIMNAKLPKGELKLRSAILPEEVNKLAIENPFESNTSFPDRGLNCGSAYSSISSKVPEGLSLGGSVSPRSPIIMKLQSDWDTDRPLPPWLFPSPRMSSNFHDADNHVSVKKFSTSTLMAEPIDQSKRHGELNGSTAVPPEEQQRSSYEEGAINRMNLQNSSYSGVSPHAFSIPENGCQGAAVERRSGTVSQIFPSTSKGKRNLGMYRPRVHILSDSCVYYILFILALLSVVLVKML